MFNFLKKKELHEDGTFDESGVDAGDFVDQKPLDEKESEIYTDLSIHPEWHLPEEEVYVYRFLNQELPPLQPNQVSVYGVEIKEKDGGLIVDAFVRNSLSKGIQMKPAAIIILDKQGETVARQPFDLSAVGTIPGKSSRPWTFLFPPSSIRDSEKEIPAQGWRLALELKKKPTKHSLDLSDHWKESLPQEEAQRLHQLVDSMKPPKAGEVNFFGLDARQADNGDLHVTLLIRNGSEQGLTLRQLPLRFEDRSEEVVAEGGFKLKSLTVNMNTSKPWTFIFPAESLKKTGFGFVEMEGLSSTEVMEI
ncbi:accessory Sec system S-layer assembly protein [Halobacillus dabanensis]|uniref:Accessory Sec system S-layer assembly protein n=1 Tax=Halobacillus dabanensis TaxID=240302 RepID=A0A1I3XF12_HALDA|nr:accessory Sec system S-layer assembly protein [Halobacillus dabanensis]SFK18103.1 accessory Sec system S-layer assembly protein [Halobacillus dabanensis]